MHLRPNYGKIDKELYDGRGTVRKMVVGPLLPTVEEGADVFLPSPKEGGGSMGLYEVASLVLQALGVLVGILALCESRKK